MVMLWFSPLSLLKPSPPRRIPGVNTRILFGAVISGGRGFTSHKSAGCWLRVVANRWPASNLSPLQPTKYPYEN